MKQNTGFLQRLKTHRGTKLRPREARLLPFGGCSAMPDPALQAKHLYLGMAAQLPATLGALRASEFTPARVGRSVKDELRENLIARLRTVAVAKTEDGTLFPGIVGYEDTVIPQLVNAL